MFGVKQEEFDREHELRIAAEARETLLREQLANASAQLELERARHAEERQDLLDRFLPKPILTGENGSEPSARLTAADVRNMPAYTKQEMARRNLLVAQLEAKEMEEAQEAAIQKRNSVLTDEERLHQERLTADEGNWLDNLLGMSKKKTEAPVEEQQHAGT